MRTKHIFQFDFSPIRQQRDVILIAQHLYVWRHEHFERKWNGRDNADALSIKRIAVIHPTTPHY